MALLTKCVVSLYKLKKQQFTTIPPYPFKLEKEIQTLTEKNLKTVFNLELIRSEFSLRSSRIDTLAFDKENNSFVIIEYKRGVNFSVVDQGVSYLNLMLENKAEFILGYNDAVGKNLRRNDVDWSQPRIIFVSQEFTTFQKEAIRFKDLPIELWQIKRFQNDLISFDRVKTAKATESIRNLSKRDTTLDKVTKEVAVYTEDKLLQKANPSIAELYEKVKDLILNLAEIEIQPRKHYIAFILNTNVVDIQIQNKALKLCINVPKGALEDPKKMARDVSSIGRLGNGDYEVKISNEQDLDYVIGLIKQAINRKDN